MRYKLKKYELDFKCSYEFFKKKLLDINALSSNLINLLNFKDGVFFTILPEKINKEKINAFEYGGMTSGITDQIQLLILDKLNLNDNLSCVFDDVTVDFSLDYKDTLFLNCGLVHRKEVYYVLTRRNANIELVSDCFYASNAIWHSLCILSKIHLDNKKDKRLTLKEIKDICLNTQLIMISAYDGEGYIFWKKRIRMFLSNCKTSIPSTKEQNETGRTPASSKEPQPVPEWNY